MKINIELIDNIQYSKLVKDIIVIIGQDTLGQLEAISMNLKN